MLIRNVAWPPGVMMPVVKGVGAPDPKKVSVHFPALPTVPKGSAYVPMRSAVKPTLDRLSTTGCR